MLRTFQQEIQRHNHVASLVNWQTSSRSVTARSVPAWGTRLTNRYNRTLLHGIYCTCIIHYYNIVHVCHYAVNSLEYN